MTSMLKNFWRFLADDFFLSEEFFGAFTPIVVYWIHSSIYMMLGSIEKYRLYPKEEEVKNIVTRAQAVKGVLCLHIFQTSTLIVVLSLAPKSTADTRSPSLLLLACQFFVAMVVLDTYQYFSHWILHFNKFLYRHIHYIHHRLLVPHAHGSSYGHYVSDSVIDAGGAGFAAYISGMSTRTATFFFAFTVIKVIDDHCGLWLPGNPFHMIFTNNSAYHAYHHQLGCGDYNLSQPFFITWDKIMGTYMPVTVEKRKGGEQGFVVKALEVEKRKGGEEGGVVKPFKVE